MNVFIGTSGFAYKEWKGIFYPEKIKAADMLRFYASRFGSVEINATFYRMPQPGMLSGWLAQVPPSFRFVLKAPKAITHIARLKDIEQPLATFLERSVALGSQLGPILIQLPPNLKKDLGRLSDCLALLPKGTRAAFEFRNATWFSDDVYSLLKAHDQALCIAESDELHTPFVASASFGYMRLRELDYGPADLAAYAAKIRAQAWQDCYVFFKHEDGGLGAKFATSLSEFFAAGSASAR